MEKDVKITITKNGPYVLYGIPLNKEFIETDKKGYPISYKKIKDYPKQETCSLCRCGKSSDKPFCDGTHLKIKFDGTENKELNNYIDRADKVEGKKLVLTDDISLCSGAGFCRGREGNTWDLTKSNDKKSNEIAIKQACNCSSGRLVIWDKKTNKPIEPKFKPSATILYEPWKKVGSSIWVKGNIPIFSSEEKKYETRNRVALCRCGKSINKPFCDGTHRAINFKDEEEALTGN